MLKILVSIPIFALLAALAAVPAHAQDATPPPLDSSRAYDEQDAQAIDGMLMCPVCAGQTIDQSQALIARQMRQVVREKLAQGESREQILDYFAGVYGSDILATPGKSGVNLVAWTVPVAGVLAALAAGFLVLRSMLARPANGDSGGSAGTPPVAQDPDPYLEAVDRELALSDSFSTPLAPEREATPRRRSRRPKMADLGAISLYVALALASYSAIGSVVGKQLNAPALVESAHRAAYLVVLALLVATLSLVGAFISRDFQVAYVAAHSDLAMPDRFTWVAFYAGNEGSLLYIAFALSVMAAIAIWRSPQQLRDTLPYTSAILMVVLAFFLAVTGFMANPFDKLPITPPDGQGINPLLTHLGMFLHLPC